MQITGTHLPSFSFQMWVNLKDTDEVDLEFNLRLQRDSGSFAAHG